MAKFGCILTHDVFFASKVTGTAQALGYFVKSTSSLQRMKEWTASGELTLVILDLDCPGISPDDVIAALPEPTTVTTAAFGPHIQEAKLDAARAAGFNIVLPRSRFSSGLTELLQAALELKSS